MRYNRLYLLSARTSARPPYALNSHLHWSRIMFFVRDTGNVLDDHNNNYDDDGMGQITMITIMVMLMVMTVSLTGCVRAGREVT